MASGSPITSYLSISLLSTLIDEHLDYMHADHIHANDFNIREAFEIMIELDFGSTSESMLDENQPDE
jgi:hypothetical protein